MRMSGSADRSNSVSRCHRKAGGLSRLALRDRLIVQTRLSVHPRTKIRTAQPCRDRQTSGLPSRRITTSLFLGALCDLCGGSC